MKSKTNVSKRISLGLLAAVLACGIMSGCDKKDNTQGDGDTPSAAEKPDNTDQGEGDISEEMKNSQYSAALLNTDIEKTDLAMSDKVSEEIIKINSAAWKYYNDLFKSAAFISNCGYLYSLTSGTEVSMEDLVKGGYYTCPEDLPQLMDSDILLLMPKDVIDRDVDVMDATFACLFTAVRTSEGVFVSSPEDKGGMMSYENYRDLIMNYVPEHGDIIYPKKNDENYKGIISAINEKVGTQKQYDVKYMICDELYAVAVVGNKEDLTDVKEYVLTKADGKWTVPEGGAGLEESNDNITAVNVRFPKVSAAMIPPFVIGKRVKIMTDLSSYTESLKDLGLITESDLPATYQCGVNGFIYMEFKSGKKIAGGIKDAESSQPELACIAVNNAAEAVRYMRSLSPKAPIYVINMNY